MRELFTGGPLASFGVVNSLVHIVLYVYYFASFWSPLKRYAARFKIFVTRIQTVSTYRVQSFIRYSKNSCFSFTRSSFQIQIMGYAMFYGYVLIQRSTGDFPRYLIIYAQFSAVFLTSLFIRFYFKTYFKSLKKTN